MKKFSSDKKFYYNINERSGLLRIEYYLNVGDGTEENFVPICGTNASVFDDVVLAQNEAQRMLDKYEQSPNLFNG